MSPLQKLLLIGALGVAGAAAAAAIRNTAADAIGGAVAIVSLVAVTRSAIQMAGDSGAPEEGGSLDSSDGAAPHPPGGAREAGTV
jgi:hypothetical protein